MTTLAPPLRKPRIRLAPIPKSAGKDESIETLRGIAILLVVFSHVILDPKNPVYAPDHPVGRVIEHLVKSLWPIRFPLFIVISGFVYSIRPVQPHKVRRFLTGKARRLLIPYFSVSLLMCVATAAAKHDWSMFHLQNLLDVYIYPIAHMWFLPAIFLCMMTAAALDLFKLLDRVRSWLAVTAIATVLSLQFFQDQGLGAQHSPFYARYLYILPYFLLGCGLYRFPERLLQAKFLIPMGIICLACYGLQQLDYLSILPIGTGRHGVIATLIGLTGNVVVFRFRPRVTWLARIGHYSYAIYLFHFLFISIGRRIPLYLGIHDPSFDCMMRLSAGIIGPILVEWVALKIQPLRLFLLGLK